MNSRRVAHISILPPELLTQIFQYLSLSDRLHFRFVHLLLIFLTPWGSARCIHRSLRLIRRKIGHCAGLSSSLSLFYEETCSKQCCGSGSKSGSTGSTCLWTSWNRIHQSEVWIRLLIRIWILLSPGKKSKKKP
jgi:hypothetical protein